MAAAIITALMIALVSVGVAGFQSLKGDMRDMEVRLSTAIAASEARQREGLKDFKQDLKDFKAEIKADNRSLNDKLDRVLENLPATKG